MKAHQVIPLFGITILMLGMPCNIVSAHHIRHQRLLAGVTLIRHHHLHYHHHGRPWRRLADTHGLIRYSNQGHAKLNAIRDQLIKDIELERLEAGVPPLKVTTPLQKIANYRIVRNQYAYEHYNQYLNYPHNTSNPSDNWVHGVDTHTTAEDYLYRHHYIWHYVSSNAGYWDPTKLYYDDDMPVLYGTSAEGIADNFDNELMNHDNVFGNHNSHRFAEISRKYKYLGVSVRFSNKLDSYVINEQFAS